MKYKEIQMQMQIQKIHTQIQIKKEVLHHWATITVWFTHIPNGHFNAVEYNKIHQDFTIINHHHRDIDIFATNFFA